MNTPSSDALFVTLQAFVMALTALDIDHVVQGLGNDVPQPDGPHVVMTATRQDPLSTNHSMYNGTTQERTAQVSMQYTIQIDCYGPQSSDMATTLSMMWRDPYGCDAMAPDAQPLYASTPVQVPLINAEANYEQRWTFSALLQFNPSVTVPQQSATVLGVDLVSVDAEYPPSP